MNLELDDEGYPTTETLNQITEFKCTTDLQVVELMDAVGKIWTFGDWGWKKDFKNNSQTYANAESRGETWYYVSTGGWSGNEEIIHALRSNEFFWVLWWYSSRVGGHYEFRIQHLIFK